MVVQVRRLLHKLGVFRRRENVRRLSHLSFTQLASLRVLPGKFQRVQCTFVDLVVHRRMRRYHEARNALTSAQEVERLRLEAEWASEVILRRGGYS